MEIKPLDYYQERYQQVSEALTEASGNVDIPRINRLGKLLSKVSAMLDLALIKENNESLFNVLIQGVNPRLIEEV